MEGKCSECGELKEIHAKKCCYSCYRHKNWKQKKIICKNCGLEKNHHSFGLCSACNMKLNHYDLVKAHNVRKYHNISLELYKKIATSCLICGFDKIVDLHHLDHNRNNNSENNLIPLCPNHHKMLHKKEHVKEIVALIEEKLKEKNIPP